MAEEGFAGYTEDDAVAWLTEAESPPSSVRGFSTEAAVAALHAVPPLLESLPVLLDAVVRLSRTQGSGETAPGEAAQEATASENWEYLEPSWEPEAVPEAGFIALAGVLIPAAELGLGVFQLLQAHLLSGSFSVNSTPSSYIHNPSPTGLTVQRRTFRFPITADHPLPGFGPQTFWFDVTLKYDGFNIRLADVVEDRGSSSTLVSSTFSVVFTPSNATAANEPVTKIEYLIHGRWDPKGPGDDNFSGGFELDAAGNLTGLQISSSQRLVKVGRLTQSGGGPVPRPTTAVHATDVHFDPGSAKLTQDKIRHIYSWYQGLPSPVQREIQTGGLPIRLTGRASTTGSVQQNQQLARQRAEAVASALRDLAGSDARTIVSAHGELGARTPDAQEDPSERRAEIACDYQVYRLS